MMTFSPFDADDIADLCLQLFPPSNEILYFSIEFNIHIMCGDDNDDDVDDDDGYGMTYPTYNTQNHFIIIIIMPTTKVTDMSKNNDIYIPRYISFNGTKNTLLLHLQYITCHPFTYVIVSFKALLVKLIACTEPIHFCCMFDL